ncbi:slipin family protein [Antrihabitans stalactiti]|uniref:Slipin family protein n=1 Tax=Antrihabitans stalactiti TaxID=2584121 RepID=A0A848KQV3_9NOCA|nr:slipin family protein [Antrihabitans stalactiti]NMN98650.1 slipin family protein [Antrihabitans stalactiti]
MAAGSIIVLLVLVIALLLVSRTIRVIQQYELGIVLRFGRVLSAPRRPGLTMIVPGIDRLVKVNTQTIAVPVPAQEGITRDNVSVRVDAVLYYRVIDPVAAVVAVQNYHFAIAQVAQTSLRSVIGKSDLDHLLSSRERLHESLESLLESPALGWGLHIDRVEIKDVTLPESMKRSMSRQAEAERERRARIITADGELEASHKLAQAAATMDSTSGALQLRLLQTVVEVAAEKNSTLVMPFPVEMLRFFENAATVATRKSSDQSLSAAGTTENSTQLNQPSISSESVDHASRVMTTPRSA